jgi:putative zinc finger protein
VPADGHPSSEEIAAYLSDALAPSERAALEAHLARCRACRRQVTSAQALLRARPRSLRWIGLALAAALAVVLLRPWSFRDTGAGEPNIERARPAAPAGGQAISALTPADGDTIAAAGARFAWRSPRPDLLYHISLTDPDGRALWTTETRDTTVVLPPNVRLEPGARYFWYVDALGTDAASWTTGTRVFVTAP